MIFKQQSSNFEVNVLAVNPTQFLIAGNDEHGLLPVPTLGKRTPKMPYVNRSFYENEFNRAAKNYFLEACKRCKMRTLDVKPENNDTSITARVRRVNLAGASVCVTFAYNAFGDGLTFNSANGFEVFYSTYNKFATRSKMLADDIYKQLLEQGINRGRGVKTLNIGMLSSVNCPASLIEAGFMTNFAEAKLMLDPDFQQMVGDSACEGVCQFLGVNYIKAKPRSYPTLQLGSRGDSVLYLQQKLYSKLYNEVGNPDGTFGKDTENAVRQFQKENGLVVDGVVGKNTWAMIKPIGGGRAMP